MQQQPPAPPIPTGPHSSDGAPRRTGLLVAALTLGLLLGGAGVGAAWAITGDEGESTSKTGPAADARGACDALAGFDESKYPAKGDEGLVALNRWNGAITLSAAAAAGDPAYKSLSESLSRAQQRHARLFEFDAKAKKDLAKARRICADI
ncbi:hypothetical protein LHJ74_26605 [Streptomyces sp. N2-109]|uniref:Uncharacterized protein n=1 Tax=Streptomyces gossypii TaxID=2883101 RepID=A0ABT2JZV4_9ACTN|nr:hypothetical protein [Streptomyces gossypii]MCT2593435.1 hypothetical protein [Streptomyces gossypii]